MTEQIAGEDLKRLLALVTDLSEKMGVSRVEAVGKIERLATFLPADDTQICAAIRGAQRIRLRRNEILGVDLFRDPAWDMLLELLLAAYEKRTVSVSALCFASGVPATTALRHIEWMEAAGLIARRGDSEDHRRVLVDLVDGVRERAARLLRDLYIDGLSSV